MEKKTIGGFIAILRKAKGLTQQEMADRLNISNKAISRWERNECSPDLSLIPAIAEMFEVSCDELLRGERIANNSDTEKTSPIIEKQIKRLLNNSLSRFKSAAYIAATETFIGFALLFAISYGFYKPVVGFSALIVFVIASMSLTLLSLNRLNDQAKDNELFDNLTESDVDYFKKVRYRFSFGASFINAYAVIWGLPFVIVRNSVFLDSVISFEHYLKLVPFLILITLAIFLIANKISSHFFLGGKYRIAFAKSILLLDVFQILCPLLIISFVYLMSFLTVNISVFAAIPLYFFLLISVIFPVLYLPIKHKKSRKSIIAAGTRNIGFWISFIVFSRGISSYKLFDSANNLIESGISYDSYYTIPATILLSAVVVGYILLQKYWVKK